MAFNCYILKSINPEYKNNTYVGKTNNPTKRIRQHNGEIVGGAKATFAKRPHEIYCLISGFQTSHDALSYEWHIKHPTGRKRCPQYSGIIGRINGMRFVFEKKIPEYKILIKIKKEYIYLLDGLHESIDNIDIEIL